MILKSFSLSSLAKIGIILPKDIKNINYLLLGVFIFPQAQSILTACVDTNDLQPRVTHVKSFPTMGTLQLLPFSLNYRACS